MTPNTDIDSNDTAFLDSEIDRLRKEADELEERAKRHRAENDASTAGPSHIIANARGSKFFRAAKRVVGWTLVAGGAVLVGSYVYGYLRRAGAPVPTGEEIGEAVAGAVNAAV